jgi:2-polyprenyl-3-methyl-5-hydroxy-6-metoxy-1,4-benzoquinol methylase
MNSLIKKLKEILYLFGLFSKVKSQKENWQTDAQKFEFDFHKTNAFRQSEEFMLETERLFSSFDFSKEDYSEKKILDLGAGSKLRSKFFLKAQIIALEPLADRFINKIEWCDLNDAWKVYSQSAESFIEELDHSIDFIISINVLDHCYDFAEIIRNIYRYLKPGSIAFLSFDRHLETNIGHPLILTEKICNQIFKREGFIVEKYVSGFPSEFLFYYPGRKGYGGEETISLNFWLRKRE